MENFKKNQKYFEYFVNEIEKKEKIYSNQNKIEDKINEILNDDYFKKKLERIENRIKKNKILQIKNLFNLEIKYFKI